MHLETYAGAKSLPVEFLKSPGLSDVTYSGSPGMRATTIPLYLLEGLRRSCILALSPPANFAFPPFCKLNFVFTEF